MVDIKQNYSLKELNSYGFNNSAEFFCEGNSVEECHEFIDFCLKKKKPIKCFGEGTNVVLTKNIEGGVLKVSIPGRMKEENITRNDLDEDTINFFFQQFKVNIDDS